MCYNVKPGDTYIYPVLSVQPSLELSDGDNCRRWNMLAIDCLAILLDENEAGVCPHRSSASLRGRWMVQSTDEMSRALLEFGMLLRLIPIHALVMNTFCDVIQSLENGIFGITRCCPAIAAQNVLCLEPFFNVSNQGVSLTPRVKEGD